MLGCILPMPNTVIPDMLEMLRVPHGSITWHRSLMLLLLRLCTRRLPPSVWGGCGYVRYLAVYIRNRHRVQSRMPDDGCLQPKDVKRLRKN